MCLLTLLAMKEVSMQPSARYSKCVTYCYGCLLIVAILRVPPLQNVFIDDPLVKKILMKSPGSSSLTSRSIATIPYLLFLHLDFCFLFS
jgi:hypothetical protein